MKPEEYIAHVQSRLQSEEQRCGRFFERQSKKEVMEVIQAQLINPLIADIVVQSFNDLVKANDLESLAILYRLLSLVKKLEVLRNVWAHYIKVSSLWRF
jgi:hypothetical protein